MIQEQTPFIQIVFEEIEEYGLYDHKIKLFNLMESAAQWVSAAKPERRLTLCG